MNRANTIAVLLGGMLCAANIAATPALAAEADSESGRLRELVDRVAQDRDPRGAAEAELIRRLTKPLLDAIGPLTERPPVEQRRVAALITALIADLRIEILRSTLPEPDQALLDDFRLRRPALLREVFADDPTVRRDALARIERTSDGPAGVLLAALVNDSDMDVVNAALDAAVELSDEVTARNLLRVLQWRFALLADPQALQPDERVIYGVVFADQANRMVAVFANAAYAPAAPVLRALIAIERARSGPRRYLQLNTLITALGAADDGKSTALLEELLPSEHVLIARVVSRSDSNDADQTTAVTVTQTVGDAALLALLNLHDRDPADFGFVTFGEERYREAGFVDNETRQAAVRAFRTWREQNQATD